MNKLASIALASTLFAVGGVWAGGNPVHGHSHDAAKVQVAQADTAMTEGEVRKVDKDTKKITLKHREIKNLGMPSMTMVFQVKDPAMLDKVKAGDKVRFAAEKTDTGYVVTALEAAK